MPKFKKYNKKAGSRPGTLVYTGSFERETKLTLINYDKDVLDIQSPDVSKVSLDHTNNTWLNVEGLSDIETFVKISSMMQLPPLLLEDILHTRQRAKLEQSEGTSLVVMPCPVFTEDHIQWRQVSLTLHKNTVVSFCEEESDIFTPVIERLKDNGKIRGENAQFLFYTLIDSILDQYLNLTGYITEEADNLEHELLTGNQGLKNLNNEIFTLKKLALDINKRMNQLISMTSDIKEHFAKISSSEMNLYLNDIVDHVKRCSDNTQHMRYMLTELMNQYLALKSDHMNDIMKTLTVLSSIFIPLGFLAGVYGMNFDTESPHNMPELKFKYGYYTLLGVMVLFVTVLLLVFKKKKWL